MQAGLTRLAWAGAALCLGVSGVCSAATLVAPSGYYAPVRVKEHGSAFECVQVPPFKGVLDFPSKYEGSGPSRDILNPKADAEYQRLTAPIVTMEKSTVSEISKYIAYGQQAQFDCALDNLSAWARAHALEGDAGNHVGRSIRKWTLGSLASAYLRLQLSASAPMAGKSAQAKEIEAWISRLADRVMIEWPPDDPLDKINNHYYWAAWSLMAASVVTNRRDLYDRALLFYRTFEKQIAADGSLPNEMARASKALNYHAYSLQPLSMIAAFGKANGVDLGSEGEAALPTLVARVLEGVDNPDLFVASAGADQDLGKLDTKTGWSWIEPYCWAVGHCNDILGNRLTSGRPYSNTRLGGDLTSLFSKASS